MTCRHRAYHGKLQRVAQGAETLLGLASSVVDMSVIVTVKLPLCDFSRFPRTVQTVGFSIPQNRPLVNS
jgi:hypothetical protein